MAFSYEQMFETYTPTNRPFPREEEIEANDINFLVNWAKEVGFKKLEMAHVPVAGGVSATYVTPVPIRGDSYSLSSLRITTPIEFMEYIFRIARENISLCGSYGIEPDDGQVSRVRRLELDHICKKSRELVNLPSRNDRLRATSALLRARAQRRRPAPAPAPAPGPLLGPVSETGPVRTIRSPPVVSTRPLPIGPAPAPGGGKSRRRRKTRKSKNRKSKTTKRR